MNDTQTATIEADEANAPLSALDFCDSCGAQALVRATMPSGTALLFCRHHGNAHRAKLIGAGADLHDETDRLVVKRESGFGG